jgi:hypothetical protein
VSRFFQKSTPLEKQLHLDLKNAQQTDFSKTHLFKKPTTSMFQKQCSGSRFFQNPPNQKSNSI